MGVFEVPRLAFPEHTDPGDHTRLHRRCGNLPQAIQKALGAQKGRKGEDFVFFVRFSLDVLTIYPHTF